jgi:hypothetical protein
MPAWIENLTDNWTHIHYGLAAVLLALWLVSCVRLALAVSRAGRSFWLWLALTIASLGVVAWVVVMVDLRREANRRQRARTTDGPPDLAKTAGPGPACPHCHSRLNAEEFDAGAPAPVCPHCNLPLGQEGRYA